MTLMVSKRMADSLSHRRKEISRCKDNHGSIEVYDDRDRRYLCLGSPFEQSCLLRINPGLLQHDYTRAMMLALLFNQPESVTLLGLGGGALVHCLRQHMPSLKITAIEFRSAVIDTAYRFFYLPRDDKRIKIINGEAGEYLAQAEAHSTDIIFSDICNAYYADPQQMKSAYIAHCHRILTDSGWLVVNYHNYKIKGLRNVCSNFEKIYHYAPPNGNSIILAGKKNTTIAPMILKERAIELSRIFGFPFAKYLQSLVPF